MITREYKNNYLAVIAPEQDKALKIGEYICKEIILVDKTADISQIEEITLNKED